MITLKPVDGGDYTFLYQLLKERPKEANISHQKLPTWEEHINFCTNHPYTHWYIIMYQDLRAGSLYKTPLGEIGIFISKGMQGKGIAKKAIPMIYKKGARRNLANINPQNIPSIKLFDSLGFKLLSSTYELK